MQIFLALSRCPRPCEPRACQLYEFLDPYEIKPSGPILVARDQARIVGRKRYAIYTSSMPVEGEEFLAGRRVP